MISITLPDGSTKQTKKGTTPTEIANQISKSLAKQVIVALLDDLPVDLDFCIQTDCKLKLIKPKDKIGLEVIRHDAAHLLAQSLLELYPDAKLGVGPVIENGFYYDIACESTISVDDLESIEEKMQQIAKKDFAIKRAEMTKKEATQLFKSINQDYKVQLISKIPDDQIISVYSQGDFIDLCRGPHSPSVGRVQHFKLLKVSGAYWFGDCKGDRMQRIYGTAWATKKELDQYLEFLEEVKKRDHRKIGQAMDLFHIQEEAKGQVFWHENGWQIYKTLQEYIRSKLELHGYKEVKTPLIFDKSLWEASGHWSKFKENMFTLSSEQEEVLAIKPMNCPAHVQIFNQETKSYRDLPLKIAEFGMCHRNEASGALHGLMRVRGFVQDDAHIFCTEDQIQQETASFCKLLQEVYKEFGFVDIEVKFSDRPDARIGDDATWDKAELALKKAIQSVDLKFTINSGEGAFYGPKIEFVLKDAVNRHWQCGTLQVDFMLPQRLGAFYIDKDGQKKHPVMLHRAILGTFERFIGILIEHYSGHLPLWLAPLQVCVATVTDAAANYAKDILATLKKHKIRAMLDDTAKKIDYKVRFYSLKKVPIILVVGKKEMQNSSVAVRKIGKKSVETFAFTDCLADLVDNIKSRRLWA